MDAVSQSGKFDKNFNGFTGKLFDLFIIYIFTES